MKIVAISDTHGKHHDLQVPDGDVLIHAGDMCKFGTLDELAEFDDWMGTLPHPVKIAIAGNHDAPFANHLELAKATVTNYTYLQDEAFVIAEGAPLDAQPIRGTDVVILNGRPYPPAVRSVKFYGSPWTPPFQDWHFMAEPVEIAKKWAAIPQDTDVLITHGPPHGVGDLVWIDGHQGCRKLGAAVWLRVQPKLHIFGHIHEGYGMYGRGVPTTSINASVVNEHYQLVNDPVVIEI